MEHLRFSIDATIEWLYDNFLGLVSAYFGAILGYFYEIHAAVHVMWVAIGLDLLAGIAASVFRRKEKFSMDKFMVGIGRAIVVSVLVLLLFSMDKEMYQTITPSYFIAAYAISGFYAYGFVVNAEKFLGGKAGKVFRMLRGIINTQVQEKTGVDLDDPDHAVRRD